ncbi:hypothetical protein BLS_001897 [Venturia inaequalis]|uniref:Uncharacterized protein n=1 Tax=Venturia inaequalis TaxID=5025 RepID=A0A8H3YWM5_VENIN|nr:hypothetical protein BLS_001897 [Venturia inaequalis]KAE9988729.1 hypothetical protein EG327_003250 [Venturia inaequalis]
MSSPIPSDQAVRPPRTEARTRKAVFYRTLLNIPTQTVSLPTSSSKFVPKAAATPAPKTTFLSLPLEIRQNIFYLSYDTQDSRLARTKAPQSLHKDVLHSRRNCRLRYSDARWEEMYLTNEIKSRALDDSVEMANWCEQILQTHASFEGETQWVEAKWAGELAELKMKVKKELWECGAKCYDVKNWGTM